LFVAVHGHGAYQLPLHPVPTITTPQFLPPTIITLSMPMQGLQQRRIPYLVLHDLSFLESVCRCIHFPGIQFIKALMITTMTTMMITTMTTITTTTATMTMATTTMTTPQ
jgi:hypothetical protein